MTAGLFNQCVAKWFHAILFWLTTETMLKHLCLVLSVAVIREVRGGGEKHEAVLHG